MLVREGEKVWETRSQVERTYRKSPIFRAEMKYAQFNPTWTVPPGIFSSGCIRIEHPMEFARLVLNDEEWDDAAIQDVIDSKVTKTVYLKEPLTVLVLYWTVNPITEKGVPEFLADVYDRDDDVLRALEAPFRVVLPDDMPSWLE